jgi:hypothetical protein
MLSRALSLATVMLVVGCFVLPPAQAQNLEAGKSPSQIFAGTCSLCHKTSRGLLKTVPSASLPGFLREHYTTSSDMASLLSAFLISNGANNTRYVGTQPKDAKPDPKPEAKPSGLSEQLDWLGRRLSPEAPPDEVAKPNAEPREAARPDSDGLSSQGSRRNGRRLARPEEAPDATNVGERDPEGRKGAKQKSSKRGKPGGEESPKADTVKSDTAKTDAAKTDAAKSEPSKGEPSKDESSKDEVTKEDRPKADQPKEDQPKNDEPKNEAVKEQGGKEAPGKIDMPKETGDAAAPAVHADPVPPVAPAPPSAPPAVTASTPQPAPAAPAGPPVPPISQ